MMQGPRFKPEHEAFRQEAIEFFRSEFRPDWVSLHPESEAYRALGKEMDRKLITKGWYTMHWPTKYGGSGKGLIPQSILRELSGYFRVPSYGGHGRYIVGPALIEFGTEEQKLQHLPKIAAGESVVCLGYTEPDAGSDLAAMRTMAVRAGDDFIVNGSKLYITFGHYANTMLLAAKTDPDAPRYKNVSLFLIDLRTPGITINELVCLTGQRITEISFDNVRIPDSTLVGELNRGFYHMAIALNFERSGLDRPAGYMAHLEDIAEHCRETGSWESPRIRQIVGSLAAQVQAYRMICWRVATLQDRGIVPSWEASLAQFYRKDINPQFARAELEIFGTDVTFERGDPAAVLSGSAEHIMREGFSNHGQGGRFVTRNVIAKRGLNLPSIRLQDSSRQRSDA